MLNSLEAIARLCKIAWWGGLTDWFSGRARRIQIMSKDCWRKCRFLSNFAKNLMVITDVNPLDLHCVNLVNRFQPNFIRAEIETLKSKDNTTVMRTNLDQKWTARSEPRILTLCDTLRCPWLSQEAEPHAQPIWLIWLLWMCQGWASTRLWTPSCNASSEVSQRIAHRCSPEFSKISMNSSRHMTQILFVKCLWNVCQMLKKGTKHVSPCLICRILWVCSKWFCTCLQCLQCLHALQEGPAHNPWRNGRFRVLVGTQCASLYCVTFWGSSADSSDVSRVSRVSRRTKQFKEGT